jgi:amino acid transporter
VKRVGFGSLASLGIMICFLLASMFSFAEDAFHVKSSAGEWLVLLGFLSVLFLFIGLAFVFQGFGSWVEHRKSDRASDAYDRVD